ncbi:16S rRNA (cytosine(967)-C(5))-methyltransferase RsmB [Bacillus sp. B15-48]|uniref:16S rRNA (cytosine(967)-C(5))-methyltransferase RsmB n=1 Tax=Bacillus sp. B15-48 TaxID=1548601 RepID=UPI00193FEF3A|nr:16S rRNA (cytosine(967)-C(5))-methyltransferase RsmB [Bacillus sp. B15-48]MBM4763979.1 16S rRNA (cytosine(967)-C(5))-methyltransferase RsmB [Bacillus sp. B15-48]
MKANRKNVRETALELLENIEKNQAYSNLLLNRSIEKNSLPQKDIGLLTELVYGTLQRKWTLDFYLTPFIKNNRKLENWVLQLMRLTLYQMVYLDRIPDRAAIYEAVEIAKRRGHKGIASVVNGVLRRIQREGLPELSNIRDEIKRLSIETSHPEWLVKRWVNQFGFEKTKAMCEMNLTAPLQTARVNTTKTTVKECVSFLEEEGFSVEQSSILPEAIKCLRGNLATSTAFKHGLLTIQDESSMLAAHALGVRGDEQILDACAAPGGKSTHIAERLDNTGKVISLDLHEHKVKLIVQNAERLGLENIEVKQLDSRNVQEHFEKESFDRILLDAPCSGLGVMRRKPDMKYTKVEEDLVRLQEIQQSLLEAVAPLVRKGGMIVYSTCTVDRSENQETVRVFLKKHSEFFGDSSFSERMPEAIQPLIDDFELQILPQDFGSDGFYIACIKRKVE